AILNRRGVLTDLERAWTRGTVHEVLINEKYIGNNVWNRCSFKLKEKHVRNSPDLWVRADDEGKSGLSLDGRSAFKQLIDDVEQGEIDFTIILVYDVSRCLRGRHRHSHS